jgi:hypothetical protein
MRVQKNGDYRPSTVVLIHYAAMPQNRAGNVTLRTDSRFYLLA